MTETAGIAATFSNHTLARVAFDNDLIGASPGAVLRYIAFRAAGLSPDDARAKILPQYNLRGFTGRQGQEKTSIPKPYLDAIRERYPDKPIAWVLRYHAAMELTGDPEMAETLAGDIKRGRPAGSKDSRPRIRRTNAELAAIGKETAT